MGDSNAPKMQASTRTAQSTTYSEKDPYNNGTNEDDTYNMQDWSYLNQPPSYDQVHRPKSLWQLYCTEACENELETVHELQHLREFGMKLCIYNLGEIVNIVSWHNTAPFPYESIRAALTHPSTKTEPIAAHQAISGKPRSKWPVKSSDQLSSPGANGTRNSIGSSEITSKRRPCPAKFHV